MYFLWPLRWRYRWARLSGHGRWLFARRPVWEDEYPTDW